MEDSPYLNYHNPSKKHLQLLREFMIKVFAKWAVNTYCKFCKQQTTSVGDSKQCSKCGKTK